MNTLYWITVLGNINVACIVGIIFLGILGPVVLIASIGDIDPPKHKRMCAIVVTLFSICTLGAIFIPSTKELYAIYGVGTVIDYVKDNKEAKKIPNNAFKAINNYLESINSEKK